MRKFEKINLNSYQKNSLNFNLSTLGYSIGHLFLTEKVFLWVFCGGRFFWFCRQSTGCECPACLWSPGHEPLLVKSGIPSSIFTSFCLVFSRGFISPPKMKTTDVSYWTSYITPSYFLLCSPHTSYYIKHVTKHGTNSILHLIIPSDCFGSFVFTDESANRTRIHHSWNTEKFFYCECYS